MNITDPLVIYVSTPHALIYSLTEFLFNFNSLINNNEFRVKFYSQNEMHASSSELRKQFKKILVDLKVPELCKGILDFQNPPHKGFNWSLKKEALILYSNF